MRWAARCEPLRVSPCGRNSDLEIRSEEIKLSSSPGFSLLGLPKGPKGQKGLIPGLLQAVSLSVNEADGNRKLEYWRRKGKAKESRPYVSSSQSPSSCSPRFLDLFAIDALALTITQVPDRSFLR